MAAVVNNVFIAPNATVTQSRHELVAWVKSYTGHNIQKVEDLSAGSAYCVMFNILFPGSVALNRVKVNTTLPHEKLANFKLLQKAFTRYKVDKNIPIEKLVEAKFQVNLEFLQWFRVFFDANQSGQEPLSAAPRTMNSSPRRQPNVMHNSAGSDRSASSTVGIAAQKKAPRFGMAGAPSDTRSDTEAIRKELANLTLSHEVATKEREFYFKKLLEVEAYCQQDDVKDTPLAMRILDILYATDDTAGGAVEDSVPGQPDPVNDDFLADEETY